MEINNNTYLQELEEQIYRFKNGRKNRKRLVLLIIYLGFTCIMIGLEAGVNGPCLWEEGIIYFKVNDIYLYISLFIITSIEVAMLWLKTKKISKSKQRLRYCHKYFIIIWQTIILMTLASLVFHFGVQFYFAIYDFYEPCFYFVGNNQLDTGSMIIKIVMLIGFGVIEIFNFLMLCASFYKNCQIMKDPKKRLSQSIWIQKDNDVTVASNSSSQHQ